MVINGKKILKRAFPAIHRRYRDYVENPGKAEITQILNAKEKVCLDDDQLFSKLQAQYKPLPEYGYDSYSEWKRGLQRSLQLMDKFKEIQMPKKIIEVGCGDGMVGYALSLYGHKMTLLDMEDWRSEKSKVLRFIKSSLSSKLPVDDNTYDFVYSYNTFEHIDDPKKALDELYRIAKPGALIYLDFGPLYFSAWGLHAYRSLRMPYPQLLFTKEFCKKKIIESGKFDFNKDQECFQPLNEWRVKQYLDMFERSACEVVKCDLYKHYSYLEIIKKYPKAFGGMNLSYEDVSVHTIRVVLWKK